MEPKGWKIKRLDEISIVKRGKFSARPRNDPQYYDGDIPFVQTGDVSKSGVTLKKHSQHLNLKGLTVSTLFPKGTILITIAANIGDCTIAPYEVAFPDSLVGVTVDTRGVHNLWLLYYLKTKKETLNAQATQNAQKNINLQTLNPLPILLPPLAEQKKIARILSTWDKAIETVDKLIENSEQQKKALMQQLLTGKKRLPGFSGEWKEVSFEQLALLRKNKITPQVEPQKFRCIELEHIIPKQGTLSGWVDSKKQSSTKSYFQKGDVLFGKLRPYLKKYWLCEWSGVCSTEAWVFIPQAVTSEFLFYLVQTDKFAQASNVSCGSKMPRAEWEYVKSCKFKIPNNEEQKSICLLFKTLDRIYICLKTKRTSLTRQKQALMQQLLTGKRRVKIDEPELTEALA